MNYGDFNAAVSQSVNYECSYLFKRTFSILSPNEWKVYYVIVWDIKKRDLIIITDRIYRPRMKIQIRMQPLLLLRTFRRLCRNCFNHSSLIFQQFWFSLFYNYCNCAIGVNYILVFGRVQLAKKVRFVKIDWDKPEISLGSFQWTILHSLVSLPYRVVEVVKIMGHLLTLS